MYNMKLLLVIFVLCILVEQVFCDIQTPGPPSIVSDKEYRKQLKVISLYIHFSLAFLCIFVILLVVILHLPLVSTMSYWYE